MRPFECNDPNHEWGRNDDMFHRYVRAGFKERNYAFATVCPVWKSRNEKNRAIDATTRDDYKTFYGDR